MTSLSDLETPIPLVDLDRFAQNLDRAAAYSTAHGLALRPHIKTHKSQYVAREQLKRGAVGVTCATAFEAEVMADVSDDVLVAYPPVGAGRAERLARLPATMRLTVSLDSATAIENAASIAISADRSVGVYVELDLGMHRVGTPRVGDAIALARTICARPGLQFEGIAFYAGHIRDDVGHQDAALEALNRSLDSAIEAFTRAGMHPRVVSGGSTPTLWRSHEVRGVTEIRPGTYVYNDRTTAMLGACSWDDCALTVLATVVSTAVPGQAVIDAGSKALGREPLPANDTGGGFGCLLDRRDVIVKAMSEEHGILDLASTDWKPSVGDQVRVIPNHVCIVTHLNDLIVGVRGGKVETTWTVDARGRGVAAA